MCYQGTYAEPHEHQVSRSMLRLPFPHWFDHLSVCEENQFYIYIYMSKGKLVPVNAIKSNEEEEE
jgi:hypothetical protein